MRYNIRLYDAVIDSYQVSAFVAVAGPLAVYHQPKAVAVHLEAATLLAVAADGPR